MTKKFLVLVFAVALIVGFSQTAAAGELRGPGSPGWGTDFGYYGYSPHESINPPDWSDNSYYTRQAWDFLPIWDGVEPNFYTEYTLPIAPDSATFEGPGDQNPFGTPLFYETGQSNGFAWTTCTDYGMGMENFDFYGHVGGMGSGFAAFQLPNEANPDLTKEAWVEYIVYLHRADTPADMVTQFARSGEILYEGELGRGFLPENLIGTMLSREWEQLEGPGGTGYWWHVTEQWRMPQLEKEYFYLETVPGTATLIDVVDIQTRCVPIPGSVLLLGSGLLGLIGIGRRKLS